MEWCRTITTLSGTASAVDTVTSGTRSSPEIASAVQPNPLLSIDQNRSTVVERIVREWGEALTVRKPVDALPIASGQ